MRLDKFLSSCGYGTRSEVKNMIKKGVVRVEGIESIRPETQIDENFARVFADGHEVIYKEFVYLMMNKPVGYISATWDKKLPVVLDLVDGEYLHYDVSPVGRLDIDTEGLLILTNDGKLNHRLLSPKNHVPKTYFARVEGRVTDADIIAFKEGVILDDGYKTKQADLKILNSDEISDIELTITEGKFHQVKRMFESVGKSVLYLKRIKMNMLELDESLKLGGVRELTKRELDLLNLETEK